MLTLEERITQKFTEALPQIIRAVIAEKEAPELEDPPEPSETMHIATSDVLCFAGDPDGMYVTHPSDRSSDRGSISSGDPTTTTTTATGSGHVTF